MEPKYKEISLLELRGMLRRWQKSGVTSAHCTKLLMLMIGERDLMGEDYGYHRKDFNALKVRLGMSSISILTDIVCKSDTFILVKDEDGNLLSFYSPVYPPVEGEINAEASKNMFADESKTHTCASSSLANNLNINNNYADNNLNNNIAKEKTSTNVLLASSLSSDDYQSWNFTPGEKKQPKRRPNPNKMEPTEESKRQADEFFHAVNENFSYKTEFLESIIGYYAEKGYERNRAIEFLVFIVNERIKPYLSSRKDFMDASTEVRVIMVRRLIYEGKWLVHLRNEAEQVCNKRRAERMQKVVQDNMNRRHHGDYEWSLPDGRRFYDDPDDGTVEIPADAPDRPGDNYFYDFGLNEWRRLVNE